MAGLFLFTQDGSSLLHIAVHSGSLEMVELLIRSGAYVNAIRDVRKYVQK